MNGTAQAPAQPAAVAQTAVGGESPVAEIIDEGGVKSLVIYTSSGRWVTPLANIKTWTLSSANGEAFRGVLNCHDNGKVRR